jgi:CheY-like chemotaxis protein
MNDDVISIQASRRVLVVDDSPTMRKIVRKVLGAEGSSVELVEAQNGCAALQLIDNGAFDLVFLDYNMPGFSGLDTLEKIKRAYPRLGVVIMTSTSDGLDADRARAAGANGFLKKPFYPADINTILEQIDSARKSQRSAGQPAV